MSVPSSALCMRSYITFILTPGSFKTLNFTLHAALLEPIKPSSRVVFTSLFPHQQADVGLTSCYSGQRAATVEPRRTAVAALQPPCRPPTSCTMIMAYVGPTSAFTAAPDVPRYSGSMTLADVGPTSVADVRNFFWHDPYAHLRSRKYFCLTAFNSLFSLFQICTSAGQAQT